MRLNLNACWPHPLRVVLQALLVPDWTSLTVCWWSTRISCRYGFWQSGGGCPASSGYFFLKTDSARFVGKLHVYEPSTSFGSGQVQPVHVRFGVVHLVHSQELPSLCIKFGQLLKRPVYDVKTASYQIVLPRCWLLPAHTWVPSGSCGSTL